jgi:hypothetical protein
LSSGLSVFAIEPTAAQLVWVGDDGSGEGVDVRVGDWSGSLTAPVSVVAVEGLTPGRTYEVLVGGRVAASFRTLTPPPGEELCRFATVSDTHIGERSFGLFPRFHEDPNRSSFDAYPARCLRAAVAEAAAWGASTLVAKGDLTWTGRPLQWETVAAALATSPVPVHATVGNHDVVPRAVDGRDVLVRYGIVASRAVEPVDLPGLRIVIGHSADRGHRYGVIDGVQRDEIVRLAAEARTSGLPVFFTAHHYVDPLPVRSRYPRGIQRMEGATLLRSLADANPSTFCSFGHSHRNRRKVQFGMPTTEVGSTKDYPGVWAGYVVHEGGIRQVVRRVADPSCLAWTEPTKAVLGGFWGWWSPGRRSWRCFSWSWDR